MSQMCFWLENHSQIGQRSLEDVIGIVGAQMNALGHHAVWDINQRDKMVPRENGINVLVEGFTERSIAIIAQMHAAGARFLILATEEPTPKGFNWGTQKEMIYRQEMFPRAAKYAEGIIHLVPGEHVASWYGQFAPTAYTELGYAPSLMRDDGTVPDYDFGFYGSLTPRRHRLLKKLANKTNKQKAIKIMADFGSQQDRDHQMRRAKVIVQLRKFDAMGLVSSSRCNTALSLGRPVIAEPHDLSHPWDEVVRFSETEESFIDEAMMMCAMWKPVYQTQLAAFKEKFPPEACIGAALEKLGIGQEAPRAPKASSGILALRRKQALYGVTRFG